MFDRSLPQMSNQFSEGYCFWNSGSLRFIPWATVFDLLVVALLKNSLLFFFFIWTGIRWPTKEGWDLFSQMGCWNKMKWKQEVQTSANTTAWSQVFTILKKWIINCLIPNYVPFQFIGFLNKFDLFFNIVSSVTEKKKASRSAISNIRKWSFLNLKIKHFNSVMVPSLLK